MHDLYFCCGHIFLHNPFHNCVWPLCFTAPLKNYPPTLSRIFLSNPVIWTTHQTQSIREDFKDYRKLHILEQNTDIHLCKNMEITYDENLRAFFPTKTIQSNTATVATSRKFNVSWRRCGNSTLGSIFFRTWKGHVVKIFCHVHGDSIILCWHVFIHIYNI